MFFYLSKIVTFLLDPLFFILLLLLIFIYRMPQGQFSKKLLYLVWVILYAFSTGFVSNHALAFLEQRVPPTSLDHQYDGVIVLSGMMNLKLSTPEQFEFSGAVDRVLKGIELVQQGKAKKLILSGGNGSIVDQSKSESKLLYLFARRLGLREDQILLEPDSRNTYENALFTRALVRKEQLGSLLLVTSAFHMYRAQGCFQQVGLKVDPIPVDFKAGLEALDFRNLLPASGNLSRMSLVIHEIVGILVYGITGKATYTFI
ncbi:MAG: hypothetical protein COB67_11450 [SAR324 cluster bacterium]|uniref:DUF218 domain-containing protein n=1 Tax=SAR324 cluster bacterium TaxID=2024889 RepID=A0A2A4SUW5_9DELT|nr:MAG: hypothetical protein COB67_11450 [SAR324 cluster bacterium]